MPRRHATALTLAVSILAAIAPAQYHEKGGKTPSQIFPISLRVNLIRTGLSKLS